MDAGGGLDGDPALDALRDVLAALGATTPQLVFHKTLTRPDVDPNQNRLFIPVSNADALEAFLTADEKATVGDGTYHPQLMQVPAYDRHGRRFDMVLRMLQYNMSYRLLGPGWKRFVADNQLAEAMAVELWAFRSVQLLPVEVERRVETGHHPDGALGLAILIRN